MPKERKIEKPSAIMERRIETTREGSVTHVMKEEKTRNMMARSMARGKNRFRNERRYKRTRTETTI